MHIWNITGCCQITAKWMYQFTRYQQYLVFQNQMSFSLPICWLWTGIKVSSCIFWLLMSLSIISWVLAFGFFSCVGCNILFPFYTGFFSLCVSLCLSLFPSHTYHSWFFDILDSNLLFYTLHIFSWLVFLLCIWQLLLHRSFYILKSWSN